MKAYDKLTKLALYAFGFGAYMNVRTWACLEAGVHVRARQDVS